MAKAYSIDLRERVVAFVEAVQSCHAAAAHFWVSVSFVVKLMQAWRKSGPWARREWRDKRQPMMRLEAHHLLSIPTTPSTGVTGGIG